MNLKKYLAGIGSKGGKASTEAQAQARRDNLIKARLKRHPKIIEKKS